MPELRQLRRGRVSGGQQVEVLVQCAKARSVVSIDVFGAEVGLNLTSSLVFITAGVTAATPRWRSAAWQRGVATRRRVAPLLRRPLAGVVHRQQPHWRRQVHTTDGECQRGRSTTRALKQLRGANLGLSKRCVSIRYSCSSESAWRSDYQVKCRCDVNDIMSRDGCVLSYPSCTICAMIHSFHRSHRCGTELLPLPPPPRSSLLGGH